MLSPKTLKYLRLTHRYVSFICAGILFVYLLSGFLLNHRKEFTFMNQKKERTVDYIFQLPANKDDFTEADARKIISDLSCNPDLYNRFSLSKNKLDQSLAKSNWQSSWMQPASRHLSKKCIVPLS